MTKTILVAVLAFAIGVVTALQIDRWRAPASETGATPTTAPHPPNAQAEPGADTRNLAAPLEREATAPAAAAAPPAPTLSATERRHYETRIAELTAEVAAARAAAPVAQPPVAQPPVPEPEPASPMSAIMEMLDTPEMKDVIIAQTEAMINEMYTPLLVELDLSPEDAAALRDLLLERAVVQMESGLAIMKPGLTDEERKAIFDTIETVDGKYQVRFDEILGSEKSQVFQRYEATQPQRIQVHAFTQTLPPAQALSSEQERLLIETMHQETIDFPWTHNLVDQEKVDPTSLTEDMVRVFIDESERLNDRIAARALDILTEPQHKSFMAAQDRYQAMQSMSLRLASSMFKSGGATTPE